MTGARATVSPGYGLLLFDEIDSTNEEARRQALAGADAPLWIMARRQTAGRGRRGRQWVSLEGNLMATLLLRPRMNAGEAAKLSFAAGLAVYNAVGALMVRHGLGGKTAGLAVKWPNDVLLAGRKAAGILLESGGADVHGHVSYLAIGVGINLVHAPQAASFPATSLLDSGLAIDPETMLAELSLSFDGLWRQWALTGFSGIRSAWLAAAMGKGEHAVARLADHEIEGVFEDIDEEGRLCLRLGDGRLRRIGSGEVFFGQGPNLGR